MLPTAEQRYVPAKEIGQMFGVSLQKVGKIANAHNMKMDEYGKWFHDKSPHSNKEVDTFRYNDVAVERFQAILSV